MKYYVTTGVSLKTQSRCWKPRNTDFDSYQWDEIPEAENGFEIIKEIRDLHKVIADKFLRITLESPLKAKALEVADEHFDANCWLEGKRYLLPAELATLYMMKNNGVFQRPGQHELVFVAGPSNPIEASLCYGAMQKIIKCDPSITNVTADLHLSLDDLDPIEPERFLAAVRNLYLNKIGMCSDCEYVFTGGFKALLLALTLELTKNARKEQVTQIYTLHENGNNLIGLELAEGHVNHVTRH